MTTETLPQAASAQHLTGVLRRSGVLAQGHIRDVVAVGSLTKQRSHNVRLRLSYEGDATGAPATVFIKTGHLDRNGRRAANTGQREVQFYSEIAAATPARIVPRCFEASWDKDTGAWHIVLEDLTESHFFPTEWPLPPTLAQCESIMDARARFHAAWWDHPRLGVDVGRWADAASTSQYLQNLAHEFKNFCDRFGDLMPEHRRELYERLLDRAPELLAGRRSRKNFTLIHGDAHVWNCFLPRDGSDDVRLIDWEVWRIDEGAVDLAYMMAIHWYPDRRGEMEQHLLDRYHARLLAHGVTGYSREALNDDYRISVLWHITTPIWQAANNIPPRVWWNNLERVLLAADDLGCRGLLA